MDSDGCYQVASPRLVFDFMSSEYDVNTIDVTLGWSKEENGWSIFGVDFSSQFACQGEQILITTEVIDAFHPLRYPLCEIQFNTDLRPSCLAN